jgi:hypothetical protein
VTKAIGWIGLILICIVVIGRCTANRETDEDVESNTADLASSAKPVSPAGECFPVNSDTAKYRLLGQRTLPNGNLEVLTERTGTSGTSFARREIDCDAGTFRYLGEGDTQDEAERDSPNPGAMGILIYPSISSETAEFACGKAGKQARMH